MKNFKWKYNGLDIDEAFRKHGPFSVIPEIRDDKIILNVADVIEINGVKMIATKSGLYRFPIDGSNYFDLCPMKMCLINKKEKL